MDQADKMQTLYNKRWPNSGFIITRGWILRFLGLLLRMAVYGLPIKYYWGGNPSTESPEFFFSQNMPRYQFDRLWAVWQLPGQDSDSIPAAVDETDLVQDGQGDATVERDSIDSTYVVDGFSKVRALV